MKKLVHVSAQRPIQGIIVFTLKGTNAEKEPSFSGAFKNTHALVSLVPTTDKTYYEYAIYAQWYECAGLASKLIEKGYCKVPEFDAILDSIIISEPVEDTTSSFYDAVEELKDRVEVLEEFKDGKPELISSVSGSFSCNEDAPALTLTSIKDTGEEVSQSIDMSCLSEMVDEKVGNTEHEFHCDYEPVPQEYLIGIGIFDGDGDRTAPVRFNFSLTPSGTQTKYFTVRYGADGFGGVFLVYPFTTVLPTEADNEHEFFMDYGLPKTTGIEGFHLIVTLSNGVTVDIWTQEDPDHAGSYAYGRVYAKAYGPKAEAPRQFTLDVDGTVTTHVVSMTDGSAYSEAISGSVVKMYPVPTSKTRTVLSYASSALPEPVTLSSADYQFSYLPFSAIFDDGQLIISIPENNVSGWPTELANTYLEVTTIRDGESTTEQASLNCLTQYISTQLAAVDSTIEGMQEDIADIGGEVDTAVQSISADVHCDVVTEATSTPFEHVLSGSVSLVTLDEEGHVTGVIDECPFNDSNALRSSIILENDLYDYEYDGYGLVIRLEAKSTDDASGENTYSNVPENDDGTVKCATFKTFYAARENGLPLSYVSLNELSGISAFAENDTLYAAVTDNYNGTYTFTFTVRTPNVTELTADLVATKVDGTTQRVDMKPLLQQIGGKVMEVPDGCVGTVLSWGGDCTPPYFYAADGTEIQPENNIDSSGEFSSYTFTFNEEPALVNFCFWVGDGSFRTLTFKDSTYLIGFGNSITLRSLIDAGSSGTRMYYNRLDQTATTPTDYYLVVTDNGNYSYTFSMKFCMATKTVLLLEPSCDTDIDLSPLSDMMDEKIEDSAPTVVTTSSAGLMSAEDKAKLNGIAANANNYVLPAATSSTLGGVKVGTNLSISNGVLSATDTTYSDATTSASGLMSASDKSKLNGLNQYPRITTLGILPITANGATYIATTGTSTT